LPECSWLKFQLFRKRMSHFNSIKVLSVSYETD
jgi:hypothetical protein